MLKSVLALLLLACAIAASPRTLFTPVERILGPYNIQEQVGKIAGILAAKNCVLSNPNPKIADCKKEDNLPTTPYVCLETQSAGEKVFALKFFKPTKQFTLTLHAVEFDNNEATDKDFQIADYIEEFCTGIKTTDPQVNLQASITAVLGQLKDLSVDGSPITNSNNVFSFSKDPLITDVKVTVKDNLLTCKSHYGENSVSFELDDQEFIRAEATRVIKESLFQAKKVHEFIHNQNEQPDKQRLQTFQCANIRTIVDEFFKKSPSTLYAFTIATGTGERLEIGTIKAKGTKIQDNFALSCEKIATNTEIRVLKVVLKYNNQPPDITQAFFETSFNDIKPLVESFSAFLHDIFEGVYTE